MAMNNLRFPRRTMNDAGQYGEPTNYETSALDQFLGGIGGGMVGAGIGLNQLTAEMGRAMGQEPDADINALRQRGLEHRKTMEALKNARGGQPGWGNPASWGEFIGENAPFMAIPLGEAKAVSKLGMQGIKQLGTRGAAKMVGRNALLGASGGAAAGATLPLVPGESRLESTGTGAAAGAVLGTVLPEAGVAVARGARGARADLARRLGNNRGAVGADINAGPLTVGPEVPRKDAILAAQKHAQETGQKVVVLDHGGQKINVTAPKLSTSETPVVNKTPEVINTPSTEPARPGPFYSVALETIEQKMPNRMDADQLRKMLKGQGVTDAEIAKITDGMTGTVTKVEAIASAEEAVPEFKDVVFGEKMQDRSDDLKFLKSQGLTVERNPEDPDVWAFGLVGNDGFVEEFARAEDLADFGFAPEVVDVARRVSGGRYDDVMSGTKFSQYQLPGGDNYREVFVTAPPSRVIIDQDEIAYARKMVQEGKAERDRLLAEGRIKESNEAQRGVELWERALQSNMRGDAQRWNDGHHAYDSVENPIVRLRTNDRTTPDGKRILFIEEMQGPSDTEQAKMPEELRKRIYDIGVKRAITLAKEGGYDGVAWTPGHVQADRYNLAKQVDNVNWEPDHAGFQGYSPDNRVVNINMKDAHADVGLRINKNTGTVVDYSSGEINLGTLTGKHLSEIVGKDLANKILASNKGSVGNDELATIGGEGLKRLYDVDLPAKFKRYGKGEMKEMPVPSGESDKLVYTGPVPTTEQLRSLYAKAPTREAELLLEFLLTEVEDGKTFSEALAGLRDPQPAAEMFGGKIEFQHQETPASMMLFTDKTPSSFPIYSAIPVVGLGAEAVKENKDAR